MRQKEVEHIWQQCLSWNQVESFFLAVPLEFKSSRYIVLQQHLSKNEVGDGKHFLARALSDGDTQHHLVGVESMSVENESELRRNK